jgi:hypothetical protein
MLISAVALSAVFALSDDPPYPPLPEVQNRTGRRYVGNGTEISYSWDFVVAYSNNYEFEPTCVNSCRGLKHLTHEQCDMTCDRNCLSVHKFEIEPEFSLDIDGALNGIRQSFTYYDELKTGNTTAIANAAKSMAKQGLDALKAEADKYKYTYKSGHFNEEPCSYQDRKLRYDLVVINVQATIVKDGAVIGRPRGSAGFAKIPHQQFYEQDPVIACKCAFVIEAPVNRLGNDFFGTGRDFKLGGEVRDVFKGGGSIIDEDDDDNYIPGPPNTGGDEGKPLKFRYRFDGMNNFRLEGSYRGMTPMKGAFLPGTMFEPEDSSYQSEMLAGTATWLYQFNSELYASLLPQPQDGWSEIGKGFALCMDMDKKQPHAGVKYNIVPAADDRVGDIARFIDSRRLRGPWHQAMTWIYTDQATLDDVNDRMDYVISKGRYMQGVYDLHTYAGVDFKDKEYEDCVVPELLEGETAEPASAEWYVGLMLDIDPKGLAKWAEKSGKYFEGLLEADQDWHVPYGIAVMNALITSGNKDVSKAALKLIEKAVTDANRSAFISGGGLNGLDEAISGPDEKLAEDTLKLLEKWEDPATSFILLNIAESASNKVKDRAAKLKEKLGG